MRHVPSVEHAASLQKRRLGLQSLHERWVIEYRLGWLLTSSAYQRSKLRNHTRGLGKHMPKRGKLVQGQHHFAWVRLGWLGG